MIGTKKVYIIGAGIGGLTIAIFLAREGYKVNIFEKNDTPGGRCGKIEKDGHRFDTGATLLMMTSVYDNIFRLIDKDLHKDLGLIRMDPIYRIIFPDNNSLQFTADLPQMQVQLERIEKGSFERFLSYMEESYRMYIAVLKHIIDRNFYTATEFFNLGNFLRMLRLKAFCNHYSYTRKFFTSELLRNVFTFQNIYVGQNPFKASAIFSMLPFLELIDGVYYPKGGMFRIVENMVSTARAMGVEIKYNHEVTEILTGNGKAEGIRLLNGETVSGADLVVANADLPYVYTKLLPGDPLNRRLKRMSYTCSAITFYWALNKKYNEIEQHNVFVSSNYKENIRKIFTRSDMPEDLSFYILSPVKTDPSAAPEGCDSWTIIVPAGHLDEAVHQDPDHLKSHARQIVLRRLKQLGLKDIEQHITFEICFTPGTWEDRLNLTKGAVFGSLSHNLMQMGYMRPHNRHRKYRNLYFVGGSTHPGNGIPMVLISAKLVAQRIKKEFGGFSKDS